MGENKTYIFKKINREKRILESVEFIKIHRKSKKLKEKLTIGP